VRALVDTQSTQEAVWIHVLKSLLDVPDDDDPNAVSLDAFGITSFNDFLDLSSLDVFIPFLDRSFSIDKASRIKSIISLFNDWSYNFGAIIDMRTVSYEDFLAYQCNYYDPECPLGVFQVQRQQQYPISQVGIDVVNTPTIASKSGNEDLNLHGEINSRDLNLYGFPQSDNSLESVHSDSMCSESTTTCTPNCVDPFCGIPTCVIASFDGHFLPLQVPTTVAATFDALTELCSTTPAIVETMGTSITPATDAFNKVDATTGIDTIVTRTRASFIAHSQFHPLSLVLTPIIMTPTVRDIAIPIATDVTPTTSALIMGPSTPDHNGTDNPVSDAINQVHQANNGIHATSTVSIIRAPCASDNNPIPITPAISTDVSTFVDTSIRVQADAISTDVSTFVDTSIRVPADARERFPKPTLATTVDNTVSPIQCDTTTKSPDPIDANATTPTSLYGNSVSIMKVPTTDTCIDPIPISASPDPNATSFIADYAIDTDFVSVSHPFVANSVPTIPVDQIPTRPVDDDATNLPTNVSVTPLTTPIASCIAPADASDIIPTCSDHHGIFDCVPSIERGQHPPSRVPYIPGPSPNAYDTVMTGIHSEDTTIHVVVTETTNAVATEPTKANATVLSTTAIATNHIGRITTPVDSSDAVDITRPTSPVTPIPAVTPCIAFDTTTPMSVPATASIGSSACISMASVLALKSGVLSDILSDATPASMSVVYPACDPTETSGDATMHTSGADPISIIPADRTTTIFVAPTTGVPTIHLASPEYLDSTVPPCSQNPTTTTATMSIAVINLQPDFQGSDHLPPVSVTSTDQQTRPPPLVLPHLLSLLRCIPIGYAFIILFSFIGFIALAPAPYAMPSTHVSSSHACTPVYNAQDIMTTPTFARQQLAAISTNLVMSHLVHCPQVSYKHPATLAYKPPGIVYITNAYAVSPSFINVSVFNFDDDNPSSDNPTFGATFLQQKPHAVTIFYPPFPPLFTFLLFASALHEGSILPITLFASSSSSVILNVLQSTANIWMPPNGEHLYGEYVLNPHMSTSTMEYDRPFHAKLHKQVQVKSFECHHYEPRLQVLTQQLYLYPLRHDTLLHDYYAVPSSFLTSSFTFDDDNPRHTHPRCPTPIPPKDHGNWGVTAHINAVGGNRAGVPSLQSSPYLNVDLPQYSYS
jgi:hypothetical protein